jgi:hypothetical protein
MSVQELLSTYIADLPPAIKSILTQVMLLEQSQIDMERPRVRDDIREIIDAVAREAEK